MTAAARRKVVTWAQEAAGLSQRRAHRFFGIARSTVQYRSVRSPDTEMRSRLQELAEERRRWGYQMLHVLLEREGHAVNHKRVYRLYREEELQVRRRRRRKRFVRRSSGGGRTTTAFGPTVRSFLSPASFARAHNPGVRE